MDFLGAIRALHADGLRTVVECGRSGLGKLVTTSVPDVTVAGRAGAPAPEEAPAAPAARTAAAPAAPATSAAEATGDPGVAEVTERLRALYATALEYPLEAVEPEADLEADLGVDSLKRAEMLGKVAAEFRLPDSVNDGRFLAHATLAELADMVTATLAVEGATR